MSRASVTTALTVKQLIQSVDGIRQAMEDLNAINANGVFNDKETKKQQQMMKKIGELKIALADRITSATTKKKGTGSTQQPIPIPPGSDAETLENFFEELILDADIKLGNLPLVKAMLGGLALDYAALCESRGLMSSCAVDGSMGYLEAFLNDPQGIPMKFDTEELLASAMYSQQFRIPLMALLLKYESHLNLKENLEHITQMWTEFATEIASKKKIIPREDRNGQKQLLEKILRHPVVSVDPEAEGGDGMTIFSRACLEGDQPLVEFMVKNKLYPPINRVDSDGSTALMHAVIGNQIAIVKSVLSVPGVDLCIAGEHGTAVQMASTLKRDPAIVQSLKSKEAATASSSPEANVGGEEPSSSTIPKLNPKGEVSPPTTTSTKRKESGSLTPTPPKSSAHAPATTTTTTTTTTTGTNGKRVHQLPSLAGKLSAVPHGSDAPKSGQRNNTTAVSTSTVVVPPNVSPGRKPVGKLGKLVEGTSPPSQPDPPLDVGGSTVLPKSNPRRLPDLATTSPLGSTPRTSPRSPRSPQEAKPTKHNPRVDLLGAPLPVNPKSSPSKALEPPETSFSGVRFDLANNRSPRSRDDSDIPSPLAAATTRGAMSKPKPLAISSKMTSKLKSSSTEAKLYKVDSGDDLDHTSSDAMSLYSMNSTVNELRSSKQSTASLLGNGTSSNEVVNLVLQAMSQKGSLKRRASNGLFTDDELTEQDSGVSQLLELKARIAYTLRKQYSPQKKLTAAIGSEVESELNDFFVSCVMESDIEAANSDLVLAFLKCVELDYGFLSREHGLVECAAADGSLAFLEAFLKHPAVRFDVNEVVCCCMFNQNRRIPLMRTLFQGLSKSQLNIIRSELWEEYNEFFADMCSNRKAIPNEERSGRLPLIETMINHHILVLDPAHIGSDGMTVLSRAAHEGDAELVRCLIRHKFVHHPNMVLGDGSTALVHAVYGNNQDVIAALLSIPDVDVNFAAPSSGSAFAVARNLKREAKVIKMLEKQGGNDILGSSKIFEVPELPTLESSCLEKSARSYAANSITKASTNRAKKNGVAPPTEMSDLFERLM